MWSGAPVILKKHSSRQDLRIAFGPSRTDRKPAGPSLFAEKSEFSGGKSFRLEAETVVSTCFS
jgi:hypothetical protein